MRRIVIFGNGKSGTTALYYKILSALTDQRVFRQFEPHRFVGPDNPENYDYSLSKLLLSSDSSVDFTQYRVFEKNIYLVRDPRDWIVSAILFRMRSPQIARSPASISKILDILKRKEAEPKSISLMSIFEEFVQCSQQQSDILKAWISNMQIWLLGFEAYYQSAFTLAYEDLVDGRLTLLGAYLEIEMPIGEAEVAPVHSHVVRTKGYGDWKNWFLESDVEYFKPIFSDYIERHGYSDNWNLPTNPIIDPAFGSKYVANNMSEKF